MRDCPNCDMAVAEDNESCPSCGEPLPSGDREDAEVLGLAEALGMDERGLNEVVDVEQLRIGISALSVVIVLAAISGWFTDGYLEYWRLESGNPVQFNLEPGSFVFGQPQPALVAILAILVLLLVWFSDLDSSSAVQALVLAALGFIYMFVNSPLYLAWNNMEWEDVTIGYKLSFLGVGLLTVATFAAVRVTRETTAEPVAKRVEE